MRRLFLHIGADKCGSSSLQGYLSQTPRMMQRDGRPLRYVLFKPKGLVGPVQVLERTKRSPLGYTSSAPLRELSWTNQTAQEQVQQFLQRQNADLISSCEFWLREIPFNQGIERLRQLLKQLAPIELHLICAVRPPLEWLNSAWWQWGAWEENPSFDAWIDRVLPLTDWDRLLRQVATAFPEATLHVGCSKPDVITTVLHMIGVQLKGNAPTPELNTSLPAAVLRLYQQQAQLRPDPNQCAMDFSALAALRETGTTLDPAPWVFNPSSVASVLERSAASSQRLLAWFSTEEQARVRADAAWWDPAAYADRNAEDPHHAEIPQLEQLCAALLQSHHAQRLQSLKKPSS